MKRRRRFILAFFVAAFVGVTIDAIFHIHVAAFVAILPIVWVAYAAADKGHDQEKGPKNG